MIKKLLSGIIICTVFTLGLPLRAIAEDSTTPSGTDPSTSSLVSEPAPDTTQGPQSPTGADGNTYVYNPDTDMWENDYYSWSQTTQQTTPKTPQDYSYNPATDRWDTTEWVYDAPSGQYVANTHSVGNPTGSTISNTGPNSTNGVNSNLQNNALFNNFYDASISNTFNQTARSGNASVLSNTIAGDALSGNASDISNIINLLQSTWGVQPAANLATFTSNINGNVVGDLLLDPAQINTTGPDSINSISSGTDNNLTINSRGSGLIDNNITLEATSGDATVSGNTTAGNATTGNADAVANVVNVLNSAINAGKSFLGVININGNLDGDILLPPNFLDQLISSSAPRSTVNLSATQNNNLTANLDSNQTINNDVTLSAASGAASVDNNTNTGSATTGNANTNLTVFNLTGRQVIGSNSLMVFVNVLGQWLGLIMDAPAGSNTAALCGGSCQINSTSNNTATINDSSTNTINNLLNLNANSGNATVSNNTNAGDATSGNATASANLLNISGSQLSLSNWFGILFINVLGTWNGSFGVNTDAGTIIKEMANAQAAGFSSPTTGNPGSFKVFTFIPGDGNSFSVAPLGTNDSNNGSSSGVVASTNKQPIATAVAKASGSSINFVVAAISFVSIFAVVGMLGLGEYVDRFRARLISHKLNKTQRIWPRFTLF